MCCRSDRGRGIAVLLHHPGREIPRDVVVDEDAAVPGRFDTHNLRQRLIAHDDALGGVLGEVAVVGDDHRDRLAHVIDLVTCEGMCRAAVRERRVRDQERERVGERAGQVVVGVNGNEIVDLQRGRHIDVRDSGVRIRRPHERRCQRVLAQVVEVCTLADEEPRVLPPHYRLTEHPSTHGRPSLNSAARSTAAMMFR